MLTELGHNPESFARVIGRNASGLRRAIRGVTTSQTVAVTLTRLSRGLYRGGRAYRQVKDRLRKADARQCGSTGLPERPREAAD